MFVKPFLLFCQVLPVPHLRGLPPPRVLFVLELFLKALEAQARAGSLLEP